MTNNPNNTAIYRVLSIDGGGMRGLYSATYLELLVKLAQERFGADLSDFGGKFDLIVGTSTGAILGSGLVAGVPLSKISSLYTQYGKEIFPRKLPKNKFSLLIHPRRSLNRRGNRALRKALQEVFEGATLVSVYRDRKIGLVIPAVNCTTHRAWVFKTPHDPSSNGRDNKYLLADVCLASSAAPIYRSLAAIRQPENLETVDVFADGGLWANNPIMVSLIEALRNAEPEQAIEIYCLGTTPAPPGSVINPNKPHWGLFDWQFGGRAVNLELDSQSWVNDQMAKMLLTHLNRPVSITRFPQPVVSGEQGALLALDNASKESLDLQKQLAATAVDETNQLINREEGAGKKIAQLLGQMKASNQEPLKEAGL